MPVATLQKNNVNWGLLFKLEEDVLDLVQRLRLLISAES